MMNSFNMQAWTASPLGLGLGFFGLLISLVLIVALIALKGYALWHAAKRDERVWFVPILIFNTLGILELIYLIFIVGKWGLYKKGGSTGSVPPVAPTA
jgi:hypothetical protein